jgi:hypothetical protein
LVTKTIRVASVTAPRSASAGKAKSSSIGTVTMRPPSALTSVSYMSKAGMTPSASGTKAERARSAAAAPARMPSSRPFVSSTRSTPTPSDAAAARCASS